MPNGQKGFYVESYYEDGENITKKYRYVEIPEEIFEEVTESEVITDEDMA